MPHGPERRAPALSAMGILGHPPLRLTHPVSHESRRLGPEGVLWQRLLLAECDVLCPAGSRLVDPVCRSRRRPSRPAAHGRAGAFRHGARPHRGGWRDPADPRPRQESRAGHPRSTDRRQLAEIPASVAAERQVFPRRRATHGPIEVGHLSGGCLRQSAAHQGKRGWQRVVRAGAVRGRGNAR